jgi:hypothetical protein
MGMEMEDCCVEKEGHLEKILEDVHRRIEKLGMGKLCSVDGCGCGNRNDLW